MKKIISGVLICCLLLSTNVFANSNSEERTYICPDNTMINYKIDDYGAPYFIENGEKIYAAIPLSHLEVKDENTITMLNKSIGNYSEETFRAAPSSYEDITSTTYEKTIDIESLVTFTTPALKINSTDTRFHIKGKSFQFLSFDRTVDITYYWYIDWEDTWYKSSLKDINIGNDTKIAIVRGTTQYFSQVSLTKVNDVKKFTLTCWTHYL